MQHSYGARSLAANTALILADRQLQRILDAVDRAGIREQTTIFVVSDHGFKTYHHVIHPNALLRAERPAPKRGRLRRLGHPRGRHRDGVRHPRGAPRGGAGRVPRRRSPASRK